VTQPAEQLRDERVDLARRVLALLELEVGHLEQLNEGSSDHDRPAEVPEGLVLNLRRVNADLRVDCKVISRVDDAGDLADDQAAPPEAEIASPLSLLTRSA
jgi:hypothetical protein